MPQDQQQQPQAAQATSKLRSPDASALANALSVISTGLQPSGLKPADVVQLPVELLPLDAGIDKNFDFDLPKAGDRSKGFQSWQFETLLDQSADLLERSLRDRAAYDSLRAQWLKLKLDVLEFEEVRSVHEQEIAAGSYQVDAVQSQAESDSQTQSAAASNTAAQEVANNLSLLADIKGLASAAGLLAKISSYATYQGQHAAGMSPQPPKFFGGTYVYDSGFNHVGETMIGSDGSAPPNGQPNGTAKPDLVSALVQQQNLRALGTEASNLKAQQESLLGQVQSGTTRAKGLQARADWEQKNEDFRRRRDEVAIEMNDLKRLAMVADGGAYNLREQMNTIRDRFTRDFRDAYSRLLAAQRGLSNILGYEQAVPTIPGTRQPYSDCLIWTRESIKQVVAFSHLDQAYILPVSIHRMMGDSDWKKAKSVGNGGLMTFSFALDTEYFPNQSYVRLRGLSVSVQDHGPDGTYQFTIKVPTRAAINRVDSSNALVQKELDQSNVPSVRYGRGRTPDPAREPDVVGTTTLRNVSPIGIATASPADRNWTITMNAVSSTGQDASKIDDIVLNLYIAARWSKT